MGNDILSLPTTEAVFNTLRQDHNPSELEENRLRKERINSYDFRRPNKFSTEHMRTLKNIHENLARLWTNFLTAYLGMTVSVKLEDAKQITYAEYIDSLSLPTLVTVFSFSEITSTALFETNFLFNLPVIEILFGGSGKKAELPRELTEIELSVLRRVYEKLLSNLHNTWKDITEITPTIQTLDTNPQFSQILPANETMAMMRFSTNIAGNDGFIHLCLPYITLEPILNLVSDQYGHNRQAKIVGDTTKHTNAIKKRLQNTKVELTAVLGTTLISVADFINFEEGDIIMLDSEVDKPINLYLDGKPRFKITPGALGTKMAGVITQIVSGEERE